MNPKSPRSLLFKNSLPLFEIIQNNKGFVLGVGMLLLTVLLLLGATGIMVSTTELKISGAYRGSGQAYYRGGAGIEEARGRLKGVASDPDYVGDPGATPDPDWSAYILTSSSWTTSKDKKFNSSYKNYIPTKIYKGNKAIAINSLQTNLTYWVKITHKREYDAEQDGHTLSSAHYYDGDGSTATHSAGSPGNIIYYGYGNPALPTTPVAFTTNNPTEYPPIEIITSYGSKADSSSIVKVEAGWNPGPPVNAALYSNGNVTINGGGALSGNDNCGEQGAKPPVYTLAPAVTNVQGGSVVFGGNPLTPQIGSDGVNIVDLVNEMKKGAALITTDQNGTNFGSPTSYVNLYSNTANPYNNQGLDIRNGTGYGTLLVEGDLTLGGNFVWNGIIMVTGILTFNGGGNPINIKGATLGNNTVDINGGLNIRYDSCQIKKSIKGRAPMVLSWMNVY